MKQTELFWRVFNEAIADYHKHDNVDEPLRNPYDKSQIEHLLYHKNWVDTVQWHFEDIIRNPDIDPKEALMLKRRIAASNQVRPDMVEYIASYFLDKYKDVEVRPDARINTESPAWAVDRFSILALKIYHMKIETERTDVDEAHRQACARKLAVLREQHDDLATAIEELIDDIENGRKYMKVYKQMKMYNDPNLNPVLYNNKK